MDIIHLLGRIIFGGFFLYNALNHFTNAGAMKGYAASKGVAAPGLMVPVTGLMMLLGGLSVILGAWPEIGLWLIIIFLVPTAFIMHDFWKAPAEQKQMEMIQFSKDIALAGAALTMLWAAGEGWPLTLVD